MKLKFIKWNVASNYFFIPLLRICTWTNWAYGLLTLLASISFKQTPMLHEHSLYITMFLSLQTALFRLYRLIWPASDKKSLSNSENTCQSHTERFERRLCTRTANIIKNVFNWVLLNNLLVCRTEIHYNKQWNIMWERWSMLCKTQINR